MSEFAGELKTVAQYIDVAANYNGVEKSLMTRRALGRISCADSDADIEVVEIGPGGGAAIDSLVTNYTPPGGRKINLRLVELDGIESKGLADARRRFEEKLGGTFMYRGDARNLGETFDAGSVDIVAGSAVLHEIYTYGGGYQALHKTMASISRVLRPNGYFAYRDVLAVEGVSLHDRVTHSMHREGWIRFLKKFVPNYLATAQHPYHRNEDTPQWRQDSVRVDIDGIDPKNDLLLEGPVGLMREIQRHYITFRDFAWRSGALGIVPALDGPEAYDWLDVKNGHKRVHFKLSGDGLITCAEHRLLQSMCETRTTGDETSFIVDGDVFDDVTDTAINRFFMRVDEGDHACEAVWRSWREREGGETYAYMTLDQLIGTMAIESTIGSEGTILLPESSDDIAVAPRAYYTRLLNHRLPNPLPEGKQLLLLRNMPLTDREAVLGGIDAITKYCSRATLAKIYSSISGRFGI